MIRIAICDDEKPMVECIADEVSRVCMKDKYRDTEVELFRTQSSGELMNYSSAKNIDILFLDIMMPGIDGVKLAEEFYTNHRNTLIVFVSSFENMVFYTMKFRPFRFVRKSKLDEELKSAIEDALDSIILSSETILIKKYTEVTSLNVYSISYVERIRNDIVFHCKDTEYRTRENLKKYEDKLIFAGFVKINGGMLVNVRNIKSISTKSAELIENISLPVSKKYYTEASERFMEYVRRQSFQ